jgi:hypothetical protein
VDGRPEVVAARPAGGAEVVQQTTHISTPRDKVRWGPIWAGLLTALFTFLTLELVMYGLGLLTVDFNIASPDRPGTGGDPWTTAIVALIAFFAGGFVAGSSAVTRSKAAGVLNGFLVAALGLGLILLFSMFGLGSLFGAVGQVANRFITAAGPFGPRDILSIDPARYADELRDASWWAAISTLVAAGAAALGGFIGDAARSDSGEEHSGAH